MKILIISFWMLSTCLYAAERIKLVLDLDDTLLHHLSKEETDYSPIFRDSANIPYITPALLEEFLRYAISNYELSFFSAGEEERNLSVLDDIWLKLFGTRKPESIPVRSRNDLTFASHMDDLQPDFGRTRWYGNYKKDLRKVGNLEHCILVDDDYSWVLKGQEANLLKVPHNDFDMAFKLIYVVGLLEEAKDSEKPIVEALKELQFKDGAPNFLELMANRRFQYRGCKELLKYSIKSHEYISIFCDQNPKCLACSQHQSPSPS